MALSPGSVSPLKAVRPASARGFGVRRLLLVVAISVGVIAATPSMASAAYITGGWNDNPTLCSSASSCMTSGNVVRMWQNILATWKGYGTATRNAFIDGQFGSNTAAVTEDWQEAHGLGSDGWVGPDTWTAAYNELYRNSSLDSSSQVGYTYCVYYSQGYCSIALDFRRTVSDARWSYRDLETASWSSTSY
ncbi:hypothetical protein GCM10009830_23400 [Glycomyces endophyticus]|uniref:Peptidoglycan binding-like domain-containing protein n=1 Tax=Glycomyces endophyticus TaxID=480996 RepID=A0ABN2GSE6_9ACTN